MWTHKERMHKYQSIEEARCNAHARFANESAEETAMSNFKRPAFSTVYNIKRKEKKMTEKEQNLSCEGCKYHSPDKKFFLERCIGCKRAYKPNSRGGNVCRDLYEKDT